VSILFCKCLFLDYTLLIEFGKLYIFFFFLLPMLHLLMKIKME
jgi:hypothetical protein